MSHETLSEKIVNYVGTGEDPTELVNLAAQSAVLGSLTASAAELNYNDIAVLGTGAASKSVVLDASGDYTFPATATIVMPASGTMTFQASSVLTLSGEVLQPVVLVPDGAAYSVLAVNSGKPHKIAEQTANVTLTLPAAVDGLTYRFSMAGVAVEAQNWIFTAPAGAFLTGGVSFLDTDAGAAADEVHLGVYANGSSHLTLTVVTPAAGTWVELICNGTIWYLNGQVMSATVPTVA